MTGGGVSCWRAERHVDGYAPSEHGAGRRRVGIWDGLGRSDDQVRREVVSREVTSGSGWKKLHDKLSRPS